MQRAPVRARSPRTVLRRVNVRLPPAEAATDAIYILMRRMRGPLVLLMLLFAVDVIGLTLMPGTDADGNPHRLTVFDAFYFMSYTATTIGFGETPYSFSIAQRMWVTFAIYNSVVGWAYAIGVFLRLLGDRAFLSAVGRQRFARQVRLLREPFLIIAGYGQMGRTVGETLDAQGRRLVVIDTDDRVLDQLAGGKLSIDVPGLVGDARDPHTLALAGLTHPYCEGVLALTHHDAVNLAVVMAVKLLRPEVPVYARANTASVTATMRDFGARGIINPYDRYGDYLTLQLRRPATHRLVTWLLAPYDAPLPPLRPVPPRGHWVVASDDHFGADIAADLAEVADHVEVVSCQDELPDVSAAVGLVAGGSDENRNLSLTAHARLENPGIFISIRAQSEALLPLLDAFAPDSVFVPARLTASEALARVITPDFWTFFLHAFDQDEAWSTALQTRLVERQGEGSPASRRFVLSAGAAPGVADWLARHRLTVGDLLRDPADRDRPLALVPLILSRGGRDRFLPADDVELCADDEVVVAGHDGAIDALEDTLSHPATVQYLATGDIVPATWLFRAVSPRVDHPARRRSSGGGAAPPGPSGPAAPPG